VLVAPGVYEESLFWPSRNGIVLTGSGMNSTFVVGDELQATLYMVEIVEIDTSTVISGLCFKKAGDAGIALDGASPIVDSCAVDSTQNGGGIRGWNGAAPAVRGCRISDTSGMGITLENCPSGVVVEGCEITNNKDVGIKFQSCHARVLVQNCRVKASTASFFQGIGIRLESCDSAVVVQNCRIENCNGVGIELKNCPHAELIAADSITANHGGISLESSSPTIVNNTISGNSGPKGGAISCSYSSPIIIGNMISGNTGGTDGGGIYSYYSSPTITENTIRDNVITVSAGDDCRGGGICSIKGAPVITRNTITGNAVSYYGGNNYGGGIYCWSDSATIAENTISANSVAITGGYGGGISCQGDSIIITGNTISENAAKYAGGGINGSGKIMGNTIVGNTSLGSAGGINMNWSGVVTDNTIEGNKASTDGGGISCGGSVLVRGNMIVQNSSSRNGGGIYSSGNVTIIGNTVTLNSANGDGGAFYCSSGGPVFSYNTVTENTALGLGDGVCTINSSPSIAFCNIAQNGWGMWNRSLTPTPPAQNNWWGDSSGPWHGGWNPAGLGDSLNSYAWDFIPWLTEPDTLAPPPRTDGLNAEAFSNCSMRLTWNEVLLADIAGYRIYFDIDTTGFSYRDTVDVGNVTEYLVEGLACDSTYYFAVTCYDRSGNESWYSSRVSAATVVYVTNMAAPPSALHIEGNYPNPFNPRTNIVYYLPNEGPAELAIYNVRGRRLAILVDQVQAAGRHSVAWNGRDENGSELASGVYFVRLEFGGDVQKRKIVLVK
jgi:predicted outer membrane repeat protein